MTTSWLAGRVIINFQKRHMFPAASGRPRGIPLRLPLHATESASCEFLNKACKKNCLIFQNLCPDLAGANHFARSTSGNDCLRPDRGGHSISNILLFSEATSQSSSTAPILCTSFASQSGFSAIIARRNFLSGHRFFFRGRIVRGIR